MEEDDQVNFGLSEIEERDLEETGVGGDQSKDDNGLDPYSYTKRDEFTSEVFKIEIKNLPRYYPVGQLKKLLNEVLQLNAHKVRPAGPSKSWAFVTFKCEEEKEKAMTVITGYKWKKCVLAACNAEPVKDPFVAQIENDLLPTRCKTADDDLLPLKERITKAVTPYAHLDYEEQLNKKEQSAKQILKKLGTEMINVNDELYQFVKWHKKRRGGLVCEMDPIIRSPVVDGYRNKCEFTIGVNPDTKQPTVGFRLASYKDGSVSVAPVEHLKHIPDNMKNVVKVFEEFVLNSSFQPFDPVTHTGIWRQLTVRTTTNDDILIIAVIHPQDYVNEVIDHLKDNIVNYFTEGPGQQANVTSIYFQKYGQKESGVPDQYEHLWGSTYITETVMGLKFRISVDAFFQVNSKGSELLYETIGKIAELDSTTVLLDVCSGTGTIGISLAPDCYKVLGVESVTQAVDDARHNALENDANNVTFYEGKAEDQIIAMMDGNETLNSVAIVDPPRAGLHNNVIGALRKAENLHRVVFVACDPTAAYMNFLSLTRSRSKTYKGTFFVPIKAIPVDLFPHTPHYELVILFERYDENKWCRIMADNPRPRDQEYYDRVPKLPVKEERPRKPTNPLKDNLYGAVEPAFKKPRIGYSQGYQEFDSYNEDYTATPNYSQGYNYEDYTNQGYGGGGGMQESCYNYGGNNTGYGGLGNMQNFSDADNTEGYTGANYTSYSNNDSYEGGQSYEGATQSYEDESKSYTGRRGRGRGYPGAEGYNNWKHDNTYGATNSRNSQSGSSSTWGSGTYGSSRGRGGGSYGGTW